jgi:hypothetical protein
VNDQPTTTEQAEASEPMTAVERVPAEATTERAGGTRELRDAQAGKVQGERPPIRAEGNAGQPAQADAPLFDEASGQQLRDRWVTIQTEFVDEPRGAVEKADSLVAEVLKQLTDTFANEREQLESGWSGSGDAKAEVSTEELRLAIQRYRSFFNRLLSM